MTHPETQRNFANGEVAQQQVASARPAKRVSKSQLAKIAKQKGELEFYENILTTQRSVIQMTSLLQRMAKQQEQMISDHNSLRSEVASLKESAINGINGNAEQISALQDKLTPEMEKKISHLHNIEGDIDTFNGKLQDLHDQLDLVKVVEAKQGELKNMFRKSNRANGDIFKRLNNLEGNQSNLLKGIEENEGDIQKLVVTHNKFVADIGVKFNKLYDVVHESWQRKLANCFTWKNAFIAMSVISFIGWVATHGK